jgi:hypothetical protein
MGHTTAGVRQNIGLEQEFFLVPREAYATRADLQLAGRTLLGCAIHYSLSTVHYRLSTIHYPLSTIHHPLSTIHYPPSTIHCPQVRLGARAGDVRPLHGPAQPARPRCHPRDAGGTLNPEPYRGTSLKRNTPLLGPYGRTAPEAFCWS